MMLLSKRLQTITEMLKKTDVLADIGTDHAYVPIEAVRCGKADRAIAMDVVDGPLKRAQANIRQNGMEERIAVRLSDGMDQLKAGEATAAVISGMGGALTIRILEKAPEQVGGMEYLLLQPQSELRRVRAWLEEHRFLIEDEEIVLEDGKYYPMMRVLPEKQRDARKGKKPEVTDTPMNEPELQYGPVLLKKKHPVLLSYLKWEQEIQEKIAEQLGNSRSAEGLERLEEVRRRLELCRQAQEIVR